QRDLHENPGEVRRPEDFPADGHAQRRHSIPGFQPDRLSGRGGALMLRYLKAAARGLTWPARAARRRPWLTLAVTGLILTATLLGGIWYVWHQWEQAQAALAADRPAEARSRLAVCLFVWPGDPEVHLLAARAARITGDLPAAEAHLKQCLKLHS